MPPWEKYQDAATSGPAAANGPWARYAAATEEPGPLRRAGDWVRGLNAETVGGALLGFADEAGAAIDATMQTVLPRARHTDTGEPLWAKGNTWGERYDDALTRERGKREKFQNDNPVASTAANVFGGVGGAGSLLARPVASLTAGLPKVAQFAAGGAVPGAVAGFGEGEGGIENRLAGAGGGAVLGGAFGVGAGYAGEGLARALRYFTKPGAPLMFTPQGQLTPEARQALQQAGIDPDTVSKGFAQSLAKEVQAATQAGRPVDPSQLARHMQGQSLPVPVPQTRGQVSGSPSAQMFENLAEKGTYGQHSERIMRTVREAQQDALRANIDKIATTIGGQPVRADGTLPGQAAQSRLASMRGQEKAGVDAAYSAARQTQAGVPTQVAGNVRGDIHDALGANHAIANIPKVMNVIGQLDNIPTGDASMPINRLFFVRAQLNGVMKGGGEDAVAARVAKNILDKHIDDAVMNGLLQGDNTAIDAWRKAISANREFAGRFKGDDIIEKLTAVDFRSGTRQLVVPPDQATNAIFNAQRLFGSGNTARDLGRLREVLGPQSPEWQGLRQEAVMRLFNAGRGPANPTTGVRSVSGANFSKAFDDAMMHNSATMKTFFTPDEISTLRQFRDVANRVTGVVRGGDNTSNTTVAASNVIQNLFMRIFTSEKAAARLLAVPLVKSVSDYAVGASLIGRTSGKVKPLPTGTQVWAAPAGGMYATDFLVPPQ